MKAGMTGVSMTFNAVLELYAGKLARTVLRGPRFREETWLPNRFSTIERIFGWEDKFRRLLLRFERLSHLHYAFKTLAYTMINLRHYCSS
jgi:hypothetical protein